MQVRRSLLRGIHQARCNLQQIIQFFSIFSDHCFKFRVRELPRLVAHPDQTFGRPLAKVEVQIHAELVLMTTVVHVALLTLGLHIGLLPPGRVLAAALEVAGIYTSPILDHTTGEALDVPGVIRILQTHVLREHPVQMLHNRASFPAFSQRKQPL